MQRRPCQSLPLALRPHERRRIRARAQGAGRWQHVQPRLQLGVDAGTLPPPALPHQPKHDGDTLLVHGRAPQALLQSKAKQNTHAPCVTPCVRRLCSRSPTICATGMLSVSIGNAATGTCSRAASPIAAASPNRGLSSSPPTPTIFTRVPGRIHAPLSTSQACSRAAAVASPLHLSRQKMGGQVATAAATAAAAAAAAESVRCRIEPQALAPLSLSFFLCL